MSNPALTNLLSNCKAEATVSPITIGSFPGSDRPLPCISTPSKSRESPDSLRSGTSSLLFFPNEPEVQAPKPRRNSRYQHHRRSLSENSLGLKAEDGARLSPFKSPSALELMQQVARTHMKSPILTPGGTTRLANKTSFPSTPFKLSHLFWGLESSIDSTCSDPGSSPARSVLFSGWVPSLQASSPSSVSGRVFKLPLSEATANSQLFEVPLPAIVLRCVEYLDNEGLNEVGLYRIPGSSSLVSRLKSHFDAGEDCDLVALSPDPHAVATLLKLFLRELPETILTPRVLTEINLFLVNSRAPEGQLPSHLDNRALYLAEQIRLLVRNIPDTNYYLLHWLTRHLARVDRNSAINKMNTSNLGMIFCPTLGITANLFRIFVTYNHLIFPLPKPPGDAALKRPSPRPYSVSSVSSLPSESAYSSVNSLAGLMKLRGIDKVPDSREAKNALLFENIAALNELAKLTPNRAACYTDSANSTIRSRNSILSYQSSPRTRRSRSIDSDTAQQLLIPPSEPTEAPAPRRRNTDGSESPEINKLRSPGILKLDYFDGTHMAHALLNMKIRRANPSLNRNPVPSDARARLVRTSARISREGAGFTLADVDLSKTRANLRPVHRPDSSN